MVKFINNLFVIALCCQTLTNIVIGQNNLIKKIIYRMFRFKK